MPEFDGVDLILEQWRRERPDLDPWPMGVVGRISRLSSDIDVQLDAAHSEHQLEPGWFDVLATLRRAGPPYRLRPSDFVKALMLTSSGTTKRLDRLERAGYIVRQPDASDRRGILISLTPEGRQAVDAALIDHLANERAMLSGLTKPEQRQLAGLLRKLQLTLASTADSGGE